MDNKNELLCSYAALLLADAEKDVTADNLNTVIKAAGGSVPAYYSAIFEKVATVNPVAEMIEKASKVGGGGGGGAAAGGAAPAAAAAPKKKTTTEEDDMPAAGGLFDEADDY